jgi:hypothetical protein
MSSFPNIEMMKILHDNISAVQLLFSVMSCEFSVMSQLKTHNPYLTTESLNRFPLKRHKISQPIGTEDRTSTLAIPPPFPVLS